MELLDQIQGVIPQQAIETTEKFIAIAIMFEHRLPWAPNEYPESYSGKISMDENVRRQTVRIVRRNFPVYLDAIHVAASSESISPDHSECLKRGRESK